MASKNGHVVWPGNLNPMGLEAFRMQITRDSTSSIPSVVQHKSHNPQRVRKTYTLIDGLYKKQFTYQTKGVSEGSRPVTEKKKCYNHFENVRTTVMNINMLTSAISLIITKHYDPKRNIHQTKASKQCW